MNRGILTKRELESTFGKLNHFCSDNCRSFFAHQRFTRVEIIQVTIVSAQVVLKHLEVRGEENFGGRHSGCPREWKLC